jgi:hypothetical protein
LRWHWDTAYKISYFEPDTWVAQRRDNNETLRADNPVGLLDLIREDYRANPVSRSAAGTDDRPVPPSCRFPSE